MIIRLTKKIKQRYDRKTISKNFEVTYISKTIWVLFIPVYTWQTLHQWV